MTTLAELVDRYMPDLVNKHGSQLLPGHYQALHAFRRCRNQQSRVMVLKCGDCHNQALLPIPAAIAAAPVANTTKVRDGLKDRRPNCWRLTIL